MSALHVNIITPEKKVFSEDVDFIAAPAIDGQVGILPGHAPFLTQLGMGELRIRHGQNVLHLAVSGGFLEVREKNQVAVFAETAEMAQEINLERAQLAAERAEVQMKEAKDLTPEEMAKLQAAMSRALLRLKLGNTRRRTPPNRPGAH